MVESSFKFANDFPKATNQEWRSLVEKTLRGKSFDQVMSSLSYDGIKIDALYTKENVANLGHVQGREGEWLVSSLHSHPNAKITNEAIIEDLERGANKLTLQFAAGNTQGIDISDLKAVLDGVYLNMASFNIVAGEEFEAASFAMLELINEKDYLADDVQGSLGIDPIGTLAATGRLLDSYDETLEKAMQVLKAAKKYKNICIFNADSTVYHNAGAPEAQEIGLLIATGLSYVRTMEAAGVSLKQAFSMISFSVAADADIYLTISKIRAARLLWEKIITECGISEKMPMKLSVVTSLRMMTKRDPWVNILRATTACFGAAIGGADDICVISHDALIGNSSLFARKVARNIQIILQEESNLSKVQDPSAGSFSIESITLDLCRNTWKYIQKIENKGDIFSCINNLNIHKDISEAWAKREKNIAKRKDAITGVSEFPNIYEDEITNIEKYAEVIQTIKPAGVTCKPLQMHRLAEDFETLRDMSDKIHHEKGKRPAIFMANLGSAVDYTARATFAKNMFEAAGIEALNPQGFENCSEAIQSYENSDANLAVICSSDPVYEKWDLKELVTSLRRSGCVHVYLAGKPSENFEAGGIDTFVYTGANVLSILENAYDVLGEQP